jgi:hypothetical protein
MRTLTNRFLLNLAISDLLATLICLPPTAYHHHTKSWTFGEFLCRFVPFIQGILLVYITDALNHIEIRLMYIASRQKLEVVALSMLALIIKKKPERGYKELIQFVLTFNL